MFISSGRQSLMLWVMATRPYLMSGVAVVDVVLTCIAHLQPYVGFSHVKEVGLFSEHKVTATDPIDDWFQVREFGTFPSNFYLYLYLFLYLFRQSLFTRVISRLF